MFHCNCHMLCSTKCILYALYRVMKSTNLSLISLTIIVTQMIPWQLAIRVHYESLGRRHVRYILFETRGHRDITYGR